MDEFLDSGSTYVFAAAANTIRQDEKEKWATMLAMTKNMRLLSVNLRDSVISRLKTRRESQIFNFESVARVHCLSKVTKHINPTRNSKGR